MGKTICFGDGTHETLLLRAGKEKEREAFRMERHASTGVQSSKFEVDM